MKGNKKKILLKIIFIITSMLCFFTLIFSGYKIYIWLNDTPKVENLIKDIQNSVESEEYTSDTEVIIDNNSNHKYLNMNLLNVDFSILKEENPDTIAWIKVGGTNIDYPIVQTVDNDFYLNHSFDKTINVCGWLFMDYRNNNDFQNYNTIIYGHNMKNMTMFGSLKNTLNKSWFNNEDNRVIKISNESNNTLWQIFSIYSIDTTNDYIKTDFIDDEEYMNFLNVIKGRSIYNFDVNVSTNDRILTLSTCHGSEKKLVVHAKLIKIDYKNTSQQD